MIYTVTTSPSLDLILDLKDTLVSGGTYRASHEEIRPGGKGINISIMLRHLGIPSTALGFVAGFSGDERMRLTAAGGIHPGFIRVRRGRTRVNLRLKDQSAETRVNGLGPAVTSADLDYLLRKLNTLSAGDFLVLAGIVPPTLPQDIFVSFIHALEGKGVEVIVDSAPQYLFSVLELHPFLVKPGATELAAYLNLDLHDDNAVADALTLFHDKGARNVLLSLGSRGTWFMTEDGSRHFLKVEDQAPNLDRTGAGDSMIAGFLYDYLDTHNLKSAAAMAVAAGAATATSIGIARAEDVLAQRQKVIF